MRIKQSMPDSDPNGTRLRLKAAGQLLAIYVSIYLAVAVVVRLLNPPDALAFGAWMPAVAIAAVNPAFVATASPASASRSHEHQAVDACGE